MSAGNKPDITHHSWFPVAVLAICLIVSSGIPVIMGLDLFPRVYPIQHGKAPAFSTTIDPGTYIHYEWPMRHLVGHTLRSGEFPLWNPYSSSGMPLAADWEAKAFSPVELLTALLPSSFWQPLFLLEILLAGIFTYLFLRRVGFDMVPCLSGSVAYMLSPVFLWQAALVEYVHVAAFTPMLFWGLECLLSATRNAGVAISIISLAIGLVLLGGQPQAAILALLGAALYFGVRLITTGRTGHGVHSLVFGLSAILPGIGLAAVQLMSFNEYLTYGVTLHVPTMGRGGELPLSTIQTIFPFLFGQIWNYWSTTLIPLFNWHNALGYIGPFGLVAALFSLVVLVATFHKGGVSPTMKSAALGALIIIGVFYGRALNIPPFVWLGELPLFGYVNISRYGMPLFAVALAILLAFMTQELRAATLRRLLVVNGLTILSLAAIASVVWLRLAAAQATISEPGLFTVSLQYSAVPVIGVLLIFNLSVLRLKSGLVSPDRARTAVFLSILGELLLLPRWGLGTEYEAARLGVYALLLIAAVVIFCHQKRIVPVLLTGALAVSVILLVLSPYTLPDRDDGNIEFGFADYLTESGLSADSRIFAQDTVLPANINAVYRLKAPTAITPILIRATAEYIADFMFIKPSRTNIRNQWTGGNENGGGAGISWTDYLQQRKYYEMVGVRYVVAIPTDSLEKAAGLGFKKVYSGDATVYEDTHALPLAYSVATVIVVHDLAEARAEIQRPDFDPLRTGIIEAASREVPLVLPGGEDSPLFQKAELISQRANEVSISSSGTNPRLVVYLDAYYPGWQAYVDGKPAEIVRVNSIVKGVLVTAGYHKVEFRYESSTLKSGMVITLVSLAVIALLPFTVRRRTQAQPEIRKTRHV